MQSDHIKASGDSTAWTSNDDSKHIGRVVNALNFIIHGPYIHISHNESLIFRICIRNCCEACVGAPSKLPASTGLPIET